MKKVAPIFLVLIISCLAFGISSAQTLDNLARKAAKRYKVDPSLVCAIINQESRWNQNARSHAGAIGLMQIMPTTGKNACGLSSKDLYNPSKNINCGVKYFSRQLKRFRSVKLALCAYNAGPHRVVKYKGCPPFKETRNYHRKIMTAWKSGTRCPKGVRKGNLPRRIPKNRAYLSAKGIADYRFLEGNFRPVEWWGLVCESIDVVYDRQIAKIEPKSVGKAAKTKRQKNLWGQILLATVKDIHEDEIRLKRKRGALSEDRIKSNIINACPGGRVAKTNTVAHRKPKPESKPTQESLSAKGIADEQFLASKGSNWWGLVCTSVDVVYDREIAKVQASAVGKPAKTQRQIKTWFSVLDATIKDIRQDQVRFKRGKAMSEQKIKRKILKACPSGRS